MDERMLKTGTVPVGDRINQLPTAANGERKVSLSISPLKRPTPETDACKQSKTKRSQQKKRKTKKQSWRNFGRKWPCDGLFSFSSFQPASSSFFMHSFRTLSMAECPPFSLPRFLQGLFVEINILEPPPYKPA